MWLNSRDLSGDDDGVAQRDGMWGFSNQTPTTSHGSIGASGSRALWNRMEPAEEEREEEALPSYLSYLQPAFRPAPTTPTTLAPSPVPSASASFYRAKRGAPGLPAPSPPLPEPVQAAPDVNHVVQKSSELAQALEHLVLGAVQKHLGDDAANQTLKTGRCRCSCDAVRVQMAEVILQVQALQNQVLELTKNNIPTAIEVGRVSVKSAGGGNWSATAPPFVPKQQQYKPPQPPSTPPQLQPPLPSQGVDSATATVLSDRISTLEGRQSAFQSQLAQIAKVLNIPTGKPGKHSPVKHLVQTLRDEVDTKVQQATAEVHGALTAEINAVLGDVKASKASGGTRKNNAREAMSSDVVLAALASEHEASLARLSGSFEELLAEEARQRAALEARMRSQLAQQEEWLQQLEGAFGSTHDQEFRDGHSSVSGSQHQVNAKLAALERKCDESRELCRRLSRLLPDARRKQNTFQPNEDEDEEEDGSGWPGHMIGRE
ncbi:hypothetical protein PHYBOEH_009561 [Phytophthora boehmeriae]|uniref:Uncharacterized protein n=1 Tax=Phytophthora boehmeriae TaxID=109152 RepID=A0A8T1VXP9_9STRA|nr:hypothetical protein PHYBOEH_009561 [Phytophthora boehmeriae]